jgi:hypothetical protein
LKKKEKEKKKKKDLTQRAQVEGQTPDMTAI